MRFYLIDFENVSDAGLNGFFQLTQEDAVDVFYTQNSNRIGMEFLNAYLKTGCDARLSLHKVAPGNQALDLQLASFLGSLIADNREDCAYYIISKDKGFECLPAFWARHRSGFTVRLAANIRETLSDHAGSASVPAAPAAVPQDQQIPAAPAQKGSGQAKQPEPAAEQKGSGTTGEGKQPKPEVTSKSALNSKVQQVLSKAKCDTQIISQTASMVAKAFGNPKIKQIVYLDLIKRHGQKRGLEIYKLVKPLL